MVYLGCTVNSAERVISNSYGIQSMGSLAEGGQVRWALERIFGVRGRGRLEGTGAPPASPLIKYVKVGFSVPVVSGSYQIPGTAG